MTLPIIDHLRVMLQDLAPGAVFECDQARMLNVKVDTMSRFETDLKGEIVKDINGNPVSTTFIYIEEPRQGYYDIPYRGHQRQRLSLMVYFCKFEPMGNDAYKGDTPFSAESKTTSRLLLRDQLETSLVRPFLYKLKTSRLGMLYPEMMNTVRVVYPSARFDANEVSVGVELMVYSDWCLWNEGPQGIIGKKLIDLPIGTDLSGRIIRCVLPEHLFPATPNVSSHTSWILNTTKSFTLAVGDTGGADGYSYLYVTIGAATTGWPRVTLYMLRSNPGGRNLWYNSTCTLKAPEGTTVLRPAPEVYRQFPFDTITVVG